MAVAVAVAVADGEFEVGCKSGNFVEGVDFGAECAELGGDYDEHFVVVAAADARSADSGFGVQSGGTAAVWNGLHLVAEADGGV